MLKSMLIDYSLVACSLCEENILFIPLVSFLYRSHRGEVLKVRSMEETPNKDDGSRFLLELVCLISSALLLSVLLLSPPPLPPGPPHTHAHTHSLSQYPGHQTQRTRLAQKQLFNPNVLTLFLYDLDSCSFYTPDQSFSLLPR